MTVHHFTVDVEEYFQVSAFEPYVPRARWDGLDSRIAEGVNIILDLLGRHETKATFFVLGWIAERHPDVVRGIVRDGHEVASHGWDHRRLTYQTPVEVRESVRRSKAVLENITGEPVAGFRAPSFSIVPGLEWALDILVEEGYRYDSSLFPIRRWGYGYPGGSRGPHWLQRSSGRLLEVPPATLHLWGRNFPAGGGAYFRLLPYQLVRSAVADFDRRKVPATVYVHPWEVDANQPRLDVSWYTGIRHYGGIHRTLPRLERLLSHFRFTAIAERLALEEAVR